MRVRAARACATAVLFGLGALGWAPGGGVAAPPPGAVATLDPCEGPDADPWVTGLRDRVLRFDGLAEWARARHGDPIACDGAVTSEFDGALYGTLRLTYPDGIELEVETMPPETSIVTLRTAAGFDDETEVREAFEAYVTARGLELDWSTPVVEEGGGETVHRFEHPEPGLNAAASLVYSDGRLVGVRLSMAL